MWVEVMAQWQGLSFNIASHNLSFWEHYSSVLVGNVNAYSPPADVGTALFVVWVNNADMYWNLTEPPYYYDNTRLAAWTGYNNQWIANHYNVITNLYAKGVRTLLMPNAVDLTKSPFFLDSGLTADDRAWVRQRTIEFNTGFQNMLSNAAASLPGLTIYSPDIFTLFDAVLASPATYGMINPGIAALDDESLSDYSLNGPGANYVYWDWLHPTARVQRLVAEEARKLIWPAKITGISPLSGTNLLSTMNVPIGRTVDGQGQVESSTNQVNWVDVKSFARTNTNPVIPVPASGPNRFYRLKIPSNWVWP
jgi:phospholipase/lecithinase/hemolysin